MYRLVKRTIWKRGSWIAFVHDCQDWSTAGLIHEQLLEGYAVCVGGHYSGRYRTGPHFDERRGGGCLTSSFLSVIEVPARIAYVPT
jgi:hypothetical protein